MQSTQHVSCSLDFSHVQSDIKQEKDREDFNVPKLKKHFPGMKKASYEDLQEQFQTEKERQYLHQGGRLNQDLVALQLNKLKLEKTTKI